jgi:hypothetical protein
LIFQVLNKVTGGKPSGTPGGRLLILKALPQCQMHSLNWTSRENSWILNIDFIDTPLKGLFSDKNTFTYQLITIIIH